MAKQKKESNGWAPGILEAKVKAVKDRMEGRMLAELGNWLEELDSMEPQYILEFKDDEHLFQDFIQWLDDTYSAEGYRERPMVAPDKVKIKKNESKYNLGPVPFEVKPGTEM